MSTPTITVDDDATKTLPPPVVTERGEMSGAEILGCGARA
jgi:hypothetical protein